MLPPIIIDQIKKREEEDRRRRDQQRPFIHVPEPLPAKPRPRRDDTESDRGVVVIDIL